MPKLTLLFFYAQRNIFSQCLAGDVKKVQTSKRQKYIEYSRCKIVKFIFLMKNLILFDFSVFLSLFATNKLHLSLYTHTASGKLLRGSACSFWIIFSYPLLKGEKASFKNLKNFFICYIPLYAINPPSTGITTSFTKLDAGSNRCGFFWKFLL